MNPENIQSLLGLVDGFKKVKRVIYNAGTRERENDAEHSYELMFLSWALAVEYNKKFNRNLNIEKILVYGLVHDLVEVYADDTDAFSKDGIETKKDREEEALHMIQKTFPFLPELAETIEAYEKQADPESIFIKSVDKILPVLNNIRSDYVSYKEAHPDLTFDEMRAAKGPRIKDPQIFDLWLLLEAQIEAQGGFHWLNSK